MRIIKEKPLAHKLILALTIGLFTISFSYGNEKLAIEYQITEVQKGSEVVYNVEFAVSGPVGDINIILYENRPKDENIIKNKLNHRDTTFTFKKLPAGRFFLLVYDEENNSGLIEFKLGNL